MSLRTFFSACWISLGAFACSSGTTTGASSGSSATDSGAVTPDGSAPNSCSLELTQIPTKDAPPYCDASLDYGEFGDLVAGVYELSHARQTNCTGEVARGVLSIAIDMETKIAVIREHRESAGGAKKFDYVWKLDTANHVVTDAIACGGTEKPPTFPVVKGLFSYNSYGDGKRVFAFRAGTDLQLDYVQR